MPAHRGLLVMLSLMVLSCEHVLSHYEDNSMDNESDYDELKGDAAAAAANTNAENMAMNMNEDFANTIYPQNTRDLWYSKNDPQLLFQPLMNGKRNNLKYQISNKKTDGFTHSINDPGKPSLSIVSPLEALQRKVAVVYSARQKERNRNFLQSNGKRSQLKNLIPEQRGIELELENNRFNEISCCPHLQRRKFYGVYRVP